MEKPIKRILVGRPTTKFSIAGAALAAMAFLFYSGMKVSSKEAFINGRISTVLSPLPGQLILTKVIAPGQSVLAHQPLGRVATTQANDQVPGLVAQRSLLEIQLAEIKKQISGIDRRLQIYTKQQQQYLAESQTQQKLGEKQSLAILTQLKEELRAIKAQSAFSKQQLQSYKDLYHKRFISRIEYEERKSNNQVLQASQQAKAAELQQRLQDVNAAKSGLQLTGPRTLDAPQQNLRDISLMLENIKQEREQLIARQKATSQSILEVTALLASRQQAVLSSTFDGVVWDVNAENGASVQSGTPVIRILDCNTRWVEAFFDEADASKLRPGMSVTVYLTTSSKITWQGTIKTIRAGSGRVAVGERDVQPPPEIARRQLPVKVLTAHIDINWKDSPEPASFCLAGRSVTVKL
ncbi:MULTISPECIES: HlyD family secretion protein [Tenebrionibacter/Tenebrionicola group]|uniref:HlyD family efflux transporter periplasmic adaptor subunit n=2 Tax=Tenebrionibacter/Tenebrionicola group TaxID=2969848 RepID=A0A8K0V837_9ENTR|nr:MULTISPECIES: HlyD family secretion protein [Tenebrionibacter/Tenebrionicola group]MBK4716654.1 HlyD family efflux transporter periplasmic adaptor subunit [Tenebrionibacter intestinalis]MBV5097328.1 HlyD family efflux transporter periplasmic adaptor subunit [Tenebrionicola larvae]